MLSILCGLAEEARTVINRTADAQVLCGSKAAANLDIVVARGCSAILSCGIAGALHPNLVVGDVVIANSLIEPNGNKFVVDTGWCRELFNTLRGVPRISIGAFFSDGSVIQTAEDRIHLFEKFDVFAVDQESIAAARFAKANNIPFAIVRTISDTGLDAIPTWALQATDEYGVSSLPMTLQTLSQHLDQTFDLINLASNFGKSVDALRTVCRLLGPTFGRVALELPKGSSVR